MKREKTSVKNKKDAKKEYDKTSNASITSRNSSERQRLSASRFSLRRLFTPRRYRIKSKSSSDSDYYPDSNTTPPLEQDGGSLASTPRGELLDRTKSTSERECPLCLAEQPIENFPDIITCHHRSCRECLRQYLKIEITESRVNIACPECAEKFHPNDIKKILQDEVLMGKYEDFMVRRVLVSDPDSRWCPAPDCGYVVIAAGCAGCPKIKCERPGCDTYFCYHCKQHWHPNQTCDAARAKRSPNMRSASLSYEAGQSNDIKPCPRCSAFIIKMNDGSCNHMTCAVCGAEFCWLCMKEISDLHYLSPSGCTFWGKKPWSRKKKILWQLGTLVGAPIGISLVAGIAVPALIIGIPVWVGRKIHNRYEHSSKHKRNLAITGGVTVSIIVSPIIAGLAVGIGVPILLAYVYGVVPISLCRSGGCGVTTTEAGGVRFEFDDENQEGTGSNGAYGGDNHSVETSQNVANPSIAPSIGEASVGMTNSLSASGSHMERVGVLRDESDHESSSNRAIAGCSLNGSICDSTLGAASALYHKMEVQADVSTNPQMSKRASLSSESANFSIGEKSMTVSFSDDASTRALAGSIAGNRDKDNLSLTSPSFEVQVDIIANPRGRNNSGCCLVADKAHQKAMCDQSSPTSTRSVNFAVDDVKSHHDRCRKCKRFSVSVGDRIHEHADREKSDSLSMQSFPGSCLKKRPPYDNVSLPSSYDGGPGTADSSRKATPRTSPSCESVEYEERSSGPGLTPVESDKPSASSLLGRALSGGPVTIEEATETSLDSVQEQGRDVSIDDRSARHISDNKNLAKVCEKDEHLRPTPLRRRSCELAMQQGRLSPCMLPEKES